MHYECLTHDKSGRKAGIPSGNLTDRKTETRSETQLANLLLTLVGPSHFRKALVLDFVVGQLHKNSATEICQLTPVYVYKHTFLCVPPSGFKLAVYCGHTSLRVHCRQTHIGLVARFVLFSEHNSSKYHLKLLGLQSSREKQNISAQEQKHTKHKHRSAPPYERDSLVSSHLLCSPRE